MSLNPLNPTSKAPHPDFNTTHPDFNLSPLRRRWSAPASRAMDPTVPGLQPIDLSTNHGSIALRSGLHTPLYKVNATTLTPASVVSPGGDVSLGRAGAHPEQPLGRERRVLPARARRTFDE